MSETRDDDGPRLETFVELLRGISEFPQEEAVQCLALILGASRNGCEFHEREVAALLRVWQGAATDLSLLECVARGFMEVSEKDGEAFFCLSESGKQEAMKLVAAIKGTSQ